MDVRRPKRMVFLHGFSGGPPSFDPLWSATRRVAVTWNEADAWCPYLVGHGPDPCLSGSTFSDEVARLAAEIRRNCDIPVPLVGYSMGARVGLGLLLEYPKLFRRAVLLGVHPGLTTQSARQERLTWERNWRELLTTEGMPSFERKWSAQDLFASQRSLSPSLLDAQRTIRLSHTATGLAHALRVLGLARMPNYGEHLPTLAVPLRLVCGEKDAKFVALAAQMLARSPKVSLKLLPNLGHNPLLENPQALLRVLIDEDIFADRT